MNAEECFTAMAIFNCASYTIRPKDVRDNFDILFDRLTLYSISQPKPPVVTDIRKNQDHLIISPARGSWAVLDDNSLSVFKSMKNVIIADSQKKLKIKMEELIKFSRDFYNYGLITVDDQVKVNPISQDLSFSMLVLKLTNKCNLLCTYCYNEGLDAKDEGISMATAFNSIDSSLYSCNEGVVIVLHGGEPLLQFKRLQEIVNTERNDQENTPKK